jgi:hypothetical protein
MEGISYVKRMSLKKLMELEPWTNSNSWGYSSRNAAVHNKEELVKLALFLEDCAEQYQFQTRAEGPSFNIFTNDLTLIERIKNEFGQLVSEIYQPINDDVANYLVNNKNKIVCAELPNGIYRYKTYFGSSDKIPQNVRQGFVGWVSNYGQDKISMPRSTRDFLEKTGGFYSYGQYFYTSDSKMLAMALMFVSSYTAKTEEYVLKTEVI